MNFSPTLPQELDLLPDCRQDRLELRASQAVVCDEPRVLAILTQRDLRLTVRPDRMHVRWQ